jgi:branched-chain amino acid transport system permease protein
MEIFIQLIINSLVAAAIYTFMAVSFNFIYGATKFFNMAHGAIAITGGYVFFVFKSILGFNLIVSVILGLLIAGLIGLILEKLIYFPIRQRKGSLMVLLVASIGAMTLIQGLLQIMFSSQFRSLRDVSLNQATYNIGSGVITQVQVVIISLSILVTLGLILFVNKTLFGKAVKAISDDEEVSKIVGINTNKIIGYVFFIGSALAGLGGILVGFDSGVEPFLGLRLLLSGVIAAIIGGVGSLIGAAIGAILLGFSENFGILFLDAEWKQAISFVLLLIFLIFRPRGIMNK